MWRFRTHDSLLSTETFTLYYILCTYDLLESTGVITKTISSQFDLTVKSSENPFVFCKSSLRGRLREYDWSLRNGIYEIHNSCKYMIYTSLLYIRIDRFFVCYSKRFRRGRWAQLQLKRWSKWVEFRFILNCNFR